MNRAPTFFSPSHIPPPAAPPPPSPPPSSGNSTRPRNTSYDGNGSHHLPALPSQEQEFQYQKKYQQQSHHQYEPQQELQQEQWRRSRKHYAEPVFAAEAIKRPKIGQNRVYGERAPLEFTPAQKLRQAELAANLAEIKIIIKEKKKLVREAKVNLDAAEDALDAANQQKMDILGEFREIRHRALFQADQSEDFSLAGRRSSELS
ncbi:hypothetical protein BJX66DRAFT_340281 [Aspergillus keveii]|uniref:Uncharacterized protein n=1 Tax=Aspergillus keveii TaxID=714993 RepID=A0ABR4FYN0_9EURO